MSEIQSRPAGSRGRGSARGGRGGHSSRGGRGGAPRSTKPGSQENIPPASYEDEGEIGQLKKKYANTLPTIKELFPDWTDDDLVFALEDADGDLETAIERITEGNVSQWGEVKKKHSDRSRTKAKESQATSVDTTTPSSRGGRGRGGFEGRGRGRGDRGRAGRGGRAASHVNGTRAEKPVAPVQASEATSAAAEPSSVEPASTDSNIPDAAKDVTEKPQQKSSIIPEGPKKGWASLFAKPTPPPSQKKPPQFTAPPTTTTPAAANAPPVHPEKPVESAAEAQTAPSAVHEPEPTKEAKEQPPTSAAEPAPAIPVPQPVIPEIKPKEEPAKPAAEPAPAVAQETTAAPEPAPAAQQQQQQQEVPQQRAIGTGYPGYKPAQRRVLDQQEAVVMPANHAVDRAAVQFGSMGLNGSIDDIDEEREEAETRPQPPQHSPVAPRASLPPATQAQAPSESVTAPRAAPGLPPAPPTTAADASLNEFGRYGEAQKPYDPFNQQIEQPQPQIQEPFSSQAAVPSQPAATTAGDYSTFYGGDQSRNPYFYAGYGQPQDAVTRGGASGFAGTGVDVQAQVASTQPPSRYGHIEAPNSGQNTPNPVLPQPAQPSQHIPQAQGAAAHGAYNYGYPYYSSPHYPTSYMAQQHQYGRNRPMYDDVRRYEEHYLPHTSQFGYGNQYAPYGKAGMYGQPQHAFSYDQHSSPANAAFSNQGVPGRDAMYGRAGSAQPSEGQQSSSSNAFGGIPDVFGRGQSGFGQNQGVTAQQQPTTTEEATKGFEAPKAGGPSPSVAHANRPGSATNNVPTQPTSGQTGLPPIPAQQANQQAFGSYPHLNPQYVGLGGLSTHHQAGATQSHHQAGGYGAYGGGFGTTNYYGNTGRGGGWGGNYGH
ncbi:hypothetical protein VTO42DRAFT_1997 [Malbranchea cinnamomea]